MSKEKKISPELLKKLYENYLTLRLAEENLVEIYYAGKVPGHIHSGVGEEALQAVMLELMEEGDYYSGHHRTVSGGLISGVSFNDFYCEMMGKKGGTARGLSGCNHITNLDAGGLGTSSSLGCDAAVPVGAALACKRAGKGVAISECGDASSSRGPVHEALTLAASWKLPVLFVVQNNAFGISTDSRKILPTKNPGADKGPGYNMPSFVADGTDIFDVYDKYSQALEYVRENRLPAIFESHAYRWRGHFEGDQTKYRDKVEEENMRTNDGLAKLKQYLLDNEIMTEEEQTNLADEIAKKIDDAVEYAEACEAPTIDDVYDLLHSPEEA